MVCFDTTTSSPPFCCTRLASKHHRRSPASQLLSAQKESIMGYVQEARENHVKKKVEEALRSKMKQKALKECDLYTSKYAECAAGRMISVVWQCRKQAKELNECLHQYTNDSVLEEMKKDYMLQQDGKRSLSV